MRLYAAFRHFGELRGTYDRPPPKRGVGGPSLRFAPVGAERSSTGRAAPSRGRLENEADLISQLISPLLLFL